MDIFGNGGRSQSLMLGLPAVLVSLIGIILVCVAEFGVAKNLEERYLFKAEKSIEDKLRLVGELQQEMRIRSVSVSSDRKRGEELIPKDDPRRIELESSRDKEAIYLEKLISLNNKESDYKFKLAVSCLEKEETRGRGLAIMKTISPVGEPGHINGHLFLADHYLKRRTNNKTEAIKNVNLGLEHAELCLRKDKGNIRAMQIKGQILYLHRKHKAAYAVFTELFKTNPRYFQSLVELNGKLGREDRNSEILSIAISKFDNSLRDQQGLSDTQRVEVFQQLCRCYLARKDYQGIQARLLNEIRLQSSSADNTAKRVWAEHLLSSVYTSWLKEFPEDQVNQLALLKKAYIYNPSNEFILQGLTRIGGGENEELAAAARQVYDPADHTDAPALVLNEQGAQALSRSEYDDALTYFELARKKTPRSPEVLNNLSYTYLEGDSPNPKRALKLVDEALRYLPKTPEYQDYRTHFHDTRGKALMLLGQVSEAAAEFEFALKSRPDNVEILESLIKCYRANDMDAGPYERHLSQVQRKQNEGQGNVDIDE